jgi:Holliday junction resolvasome RuvABC ATP-dependent DNA helicase subunit
MRDSVRGKDEVGNPRLFFRDIIGQQDIVARLKTFTDLYATTGGTPGHILLTGEDGMGKGSFVTALSNVRDVGLQEVDAASLNIQGDLTAIFTNLRPNQVLYISNINRLQNSLSERVRQVLREGKVDIVIGLGPKARTHVMEVRPFTLVASCPKRTDCPVKLLSEFSLTLSLQPYSELELQSLAQSIASGAGLNLELGAAVLIARTCDGRPGHLESSVKRVARAINKSVISEEDVLVAYRAFGVNVSRGKLSNGIGNLQNLSGQEFEKLISDLLTRMGFQTEMTKTTGDGGIDIIAKLDKAIFGGLYLFQCKRFAPDNLVGASTVRDFYGAVTADRAVKGIFITTSGFTVQGREFGRRVGIELIDSEQLQKLLIEYQLIELENE